MRALTFWLNQINPPTTKQHFIYFVQEFNLINKKELQPLAELIASLTNRKPGTSSNSQIFFSNSVDGFFKYDSFFSHLFAFAFAFAFRSQIIVDLGGTKIAWSACWDRHKANTKKGESSGGVVCVGGRVLCSLRSLSTHSQKKKAKKKTTTTT